MGEGKFLEDVTNQFSCFASSSSLPPFSQPKQTTITVQTAFNPDHPTNKRVPTTPAARDEFTLQEREAARQAAKPKTLEEFQESVSKTLATLLF